MYIKFRDCWPGSGPPPAARTRRQADRWSGPPAGRRVVQAPPFGEATVTDSPIAPVIPSLARPGVRGRAVPGPVRRPALPRIRGGGQWGHLADKLPDPPHRSVAAPVWSPTSLCHRAGAARDAELRHGAADRLSHRLGGRGIRSRQPGHEQCLAPRIVHTQPWSWQASPHLSAVSGWT